MSGTEVLEPERETVMAKDRAVRVDIDLADKIEFLISRAKVRAGAKRISRAEFLSPHIRPIIEALYDAELEAVHQEARARKRPRA